MNKSRRTVIVFTTLAAVLSLTSALLLALAPDPLSPDAHQSLFAVQSVDSFDPIYNTRQPIDAGRWRHIYIRHTKTAGGNALTLGQSTAGLVDHFLIGNGDGAIDGEVQISQRWNQQLAAGQPSPAELELADGCISICLVGDFDQSLPTPTQMRRLAQLVGSLQRRFDIPANGIVLVDNPGSRAGVGRYFPATAFQQQLLP